MTELANAYVVAASILAACIFMPLLVWWVYSGGADSSGYQPKDDPWPESPPRGGSALGKHSISRGVIVLGAFSLDPGYRMPSGNHPISAAIAAFAECRKRLESNGHTVRSGRMQSSCGAIIGTRLICIFCRRELGWINHEPVIGDDGDHYKVYGEMIADADPCAVGAARGVKWPRGDEEGK